MAADRKTVNDSVNDSVNDADSADSADSIADNRRALWRRGCLMLTKPDSAYLTIPRAIRAIRDTRAICAMCAMCRY